MNSHKLSSQFMKQEAKPINSFSVASCGDIFTYDFIRGYFFMPFQGILQQSDLENALKEIFFYFKILNNQFEKRCGFIN